MRAEGQIADVIESDKLFECDCGSHISVYHDCIIVGGVDLGGGPRSKDWANRMSVIICDTCHHAYVWYDGDFYKADYFKRENMV